MKKLIISLCLLLLMTGCWNYQELNDFAIVTGMAIDYSNNKYEVSLLIANGKKKEEKDAQITISTQTGSTIYDAIENISLATPKELYISHLSVVVISEELAKKGLNPTLDFLLREPQSQQNFYLILAKDNKAKDMLSILAPLSDYPSQNITASIKVTEQLQGKIANASFNKFVGKIIEKGINPVANSLILVGNENDGTKQEDQENSVVSAYTKLDTLGIFKGDRLMGWATKDESIGINMLLGDVDTLYLTLPCQKDKIVVSSTNYKIKNNINKDKVTVTLKATGMINEVGCSIDLEDPKTIKIYEKKAAKKMKDYAEKAIKKAKNLKTDIFGYGYQIYHKYPKYFKTIDDWDKTFSHLEINIQTEFKLNTKGILEQTIGYEEK